jgi:hypothetical protein
VLESLHPETSLAVDSMGMKNITGIPLDTNNMIIKDKNDIEATSLVGNNNSGDQDILLGLLEGDTAIAVEVNGDGNKLTTKEDKNSRTLNDKNDLGILVLLEDSTPTNDNRNTKISAATDRSETKIDVIDVLLTGLSKGSIQNMENKNSDNRKEEQNNKVPKNIDIQTRKVDNEFILLLGEVKNKKMGISLKDIMTHTNVDESTVVSERPTSVQRININQDINVTKETDDTQFTILNILLPGYIDGDENINQLDTNLKDGDSDTILIVNASDLDGITGDNAILPILDYEEGSGQDEHFKDPNTIDVRGIDGDLILLLENLNEVNMGIDYSGNVNENENDVMANHTETPNVTNIQGFDVASNINKPHDTRESPISILDIILGDTDDTSRQNVVTKVDNKSRVLVGGDKFEIMMMKNVQHEDNMITDLLRNISTLAITGKHENEKDARIIESIKNVMTQQPNTLDNHIDFDFHLLLGDAVAQNKDTHTHTNSILEKENDATHACLLCKPRAIFSLLNNDKITDNIILNSEDNIEGSGFNEHEGRSYSYYPEVNYTYFPP